MNGNPPSGVNYRTAYFNNEAANNWKGVLKMAFGEKADLLPTAYQSSRNETLNYAASWYLNGAGEILLGGGDASYGSRCAPVTCSRVPCSAPRIGTSCLGSPTTVS